MKVKLRESFKADSKLVAKIHPAHNSEPRRNRARPCYVILHYTGMSSAEKAIDWLAREESRVSCHYVVDELGVTTQLVPEDLRAWHAGVSHWRGETDINSYSIGIEIQNPGHADGYPNFPARQIAAVIALSRDIARRNKIPAENILAHSDIAIGRKIDPGEKFPWHTLAKSGVGHWVKPAAVRHDDPGLGEGSRADEVSAAQHLLKHFGYDVPQSGILDVATAKAILAFQRHFRPRRVDGRLDRSTLATLRRLIEALPPRRRT